MAFVHELTLNSIERFAKLLPRRFVGKLIGELSTLSAGRRFSAVSASLRPFISGITTSVNKRLISGLYVQKRERIGSTRSRALSPITARTRSHT
jgi:hypothetical protein